jgi:amidase
MSEWSTFRGQVPSGFSGRGQSTYPYYPPAEPYSLSSGSGVTVAIGLAARTLRTETDGSMASPSSRNDIVGIKPTLKPTSRAGGKDYSSLSNIGRTI